MQIERRVARVFQPLLGAARYKGAYGGRGSGKSHFFAEEAVLAILQGKRVLCVREVQRSIADSVKRLMEDKIEALGLTAYFDITRDEVRCPLSGGLAIFRGMQNHTAASVKSLEGFDVAWWEEAQTASQRSLDLLIPTIRKEGSELWFSWNPESADDPVEFLRGDEMADALVVQANWSDNPWFPEELRAEMERERVRDPDKHAHIWEGQYRGLSEARVFRNFREGVIDPPQDAVWFYGADWGFANDETAGLRFCIPEEGVLYVDAEVYELGVPTEALPKLFDGLPDARRWPIRGDSARPETIDYMRRHGFPKMRPARKGKGSVEDGVTFLQSMDIVVNPACPNLLRELRNYAYKTDAHTGEVLPVIEDKNNHLIDAMRYAAEGLHRRGKQIVKAPKVENDLLERPPDYRGTRTPESSWKVA
jgi:phage terminase large subunit